MENKRGQVTLFIIIAIVLVGIVLLIFWLNRGPSRPNNVDVNPVPFLKSCIEDDLRAEVSDIAWKGGSANPDAAATYGEDKIEYLCYSSEHYKTCTVQQPLIKEHFEKEVNAKLSVKAQNCFNSLKTEYEKKGYTVNAGKIDVNFGFYPTGMQLTYSSPMTITKGEANKKFDGFTVQLDSQMYDLLMTSISIIDYEATYGDSETTIYMSYYPDLKIEKFRLDEGSKIYTLNNVVTNETFRFAVRSLVWPPAYEA